MRTFVSVNVGSFLQPFLVSPKLFPSLNDNPNSRCETSEKLENKQFAGFEKIIFMWKPLGEMSKLTPSFSFSASIFMSDARIFGSKFVLLQILKYHQMIQYYNRIRPNLSTSTSQIINTKFSRYNLHFLTFCLVWYNCIIRLTNILMVSFICIDHIPATWHGMGGFCEIFVTNLSILANLNPLNNHKRMI